MSSLGFAMEPNADPYSLPAEVSSDLLFSAPGLQSSAISLNAVPSFADPAISLSPLGVSLPDAAVFDPSIVDGTFISTYPVVVPPAFATPPSMAIETSLTPPLSQPPSASIHGAASAYGLGVTSSLQSALEPAVLPHAAPRPAVDFLPMDTDLVIKEEEMHDSLGMIDAVLKNVIDILAAARLAWRDQQLAQTRSRILEAINHTPQLNDVVRDIGLLLEPSGDEHYSPSGLLIPPAGDDNPRKRCASPVAPGRPMKALKAEPQDLVLPNNGGLYTPRPTASAPITRPPSPYRFNPGSTPGFPQMAPDNPLFVLGPSFVPIRGWSDPNISRHNHSLSTGSIATSSPSPGSVRPTAGVHGRITRSGSVSSGFGGVHYTYPKAHSDSWPAKSAGILPDTTSTSGWRTPHARLDGDDNSDDEDDEDGEDDGSYHATEHHASPSSGSDLPSEYRSEVERILLQYLDRICSDLGAHDSKNEPIHQTLMAKKMQRLDESKDFRPFKFRIQAFTNAFLEELAIHGYPEDKIPTKKVRNFLWRCKYIVRYNEDGKKSKSKGNYIWHIDAKKTPAGWEFRPFHRKIAGPPPAVAACGVMWSWTPHVWDPRANWQNVPVHYDSPALPSWLTWEAGTLSGIPPPDVQACEVEVIAKYILDGHEGELRHWLQIHVAPGSSVDAIFPRPRGVSDPLLFAGHHQFSSPPQQGQAAAAASCVVDVLQNVKQRVVDETHNVGALEHLLTQQLVLETSIQAFGATLCGTASSSKTQRIADAVKDVVIEAAQKVVAPQVQAALSPAPSGNVAVTHASVSRMSDYTQVAIASAVDKAIKRELPHKRSVESLMLDAKHIIQASPSMISVSSRCLPATNPYPTLLPQYT